MSGLRTGHMCDCMKEGPCSYFAFLLAIYIVDLFLLPPFCPLKVYSSHGIRYAFPLLDLLGEGI